MRTTPSALNAPIGLVAMAGRCGFVLVLAALLAALTAPAWAQIPQQDIVGEGEASTEDSGVAYLTVINETGFDMEDLYLGVPGASSWGQDLLDQQVITPGGSGRITVPLSAGTQEVCQWDILARLRGGAEYMFTGVEICHHDTLKLYSDGQKAWFQYAEPGQ